MKKFILLLSCLFMSCSANSYVVRNCIEKKTSNSFSSQYDYFSGNRKYSMKIKEDTTVQVKFTSKSGMLKVKVYNDDSSYYEGNIDYDFDFTLNLKQGKYTVSFSADKHHGSYFFSW